MESKNVRKRVLTTPPTLYYAVEKNEVKHVMQMLPKNGPRIFTNIRIILPAPQTGDFYWKDCNFRWFWELCLCHTTCCICVDCATNTCCINPILFIFAERNCILSVPLVFDCASNTCSDNPTQAIFVENVWCYKVSNCAARESQWKSFGITESRQKQMKINRNQQE